MTHLGRVLKTSTLMIAIAAISLALAATAASGQANDATIDIRVQYPDGSLVDDFDVCANLFGFSEDGPSGFAGSTTGATASFTVTSGGTYAVEVGGGCVGASNPLPTRTWHNGQPNTGGVDPVWDALIATAEPITANAGSNPVTITVGAARVSGTLSGTAPADPSRCRVTVIGASGIANSFGPTTALVDEAGRWEAWVHPGQYKAEVSCFLRSAYEAWPNRSSIGEAAPITLANGGDQTGINFDLTGDFNEQTGANHFIRFDAVGDFSTPKCVEAYATDGTLVRQQFGGSVSTANNGNYRIRVSDCYAIGFDDQWLPAGASRFAGPSINVDGVVVEISHDAGPLFGIEFTECNGLDITIRGTGGVDVIMGTNGPDVISGLGGDDIITALGGDDTICGGSGNDTIIANAGHDWVDGGDGDDIIRGGWGEDMIFGGNGNDFVRSFRHDDVVDGGPGNDIIRGGWGSDVLRGGEGNDRIVAWNGADQIFGGPGNDLLRAGPGPDLVVGGPGAVDRVFGDEGTRDVCTDSGAATVFRDCETINN